MTSPVAGSSIFPLGILGTSPPPGGAGKLGDTRISRLHSHSTVSDDGLPGRSPTGTDVSPSVTDLSPALSAHRLFQPSPPPLSVPVAALRGVSLGAIPEEGPRQATLTARAKSAFERLLPPGIASFPPPGTIMGLPNLSRALRERLENLAQRYNCAFHEGNSFLALLLFNFQTFNEGLYKDLTAAFEETHPTKKAVAIIRVLTEAKKTESPLRAELYEVGIQLCRVGRLDVWDRPLDEHLSAPLERIPFFDPHTASDMANICNEGLLAVGFLAHSLLHVHRFTTFFIETLGAHSDIALLPPSSSLLEVYPLTKSARARIHTILAEHPYFKGIESAKKRAFFYCKAFDFLHQADALQLDYCRSYNEFIALYEASYEEIKDLQVTLNKTTKNIPRTSIFLQLMVHHYEALLTRRRLWVEQMRWILDQGNKVLEDGLCLTYLHSYLQSDLSKWDTQNLDFRTDLLAYVRARPRIASSSPDATAFLNQFKAFTEAMRVAGSFLEDLNDSWETVEHANRYALMCFHELVKRKVFRLEGSSSEAGIIFDLTKIDRRSPIRVCDAFGNYITIRFTPPSSAPSAPDSSTALAPPEKEKDVVPAKAEKAPTPLLLSSDFSALFKEDPLSLPPLKAYEAQTAFQNAHFYAEDLYRLLWLVKQGTLSSDAGHTILDIAVAAGFCLEQMLTASLLERKSATKAIHKSLFPEGKHPRLRELLTSCGFDYALEGDLYDTLQTTVATADGMELSTRRLPRSFRHHPLLAECYHLLTADHVDAAQKSLQQAVELGKQVLQAYVTMLGTLPSAAPTVPSDLSEQLGAFSFPVVVRTEATKALNSPVHTLRTNVQGNLAAAAFHPSTDEYTAVIFYTLDRLDHFYKGLYHPETFRLSDIQARLGLRNLVEEVLYLQTTLSDVAIKRSDIGHNLMILAEALHLDRVLTSEELNFLQSNTRLRNEARYQVVEASSKAAKKERAKASNAGAGSSSATSSTEEAFEMVRNDRQIKMQRRLDQELALAGSIIRKAMEMLPSSDTPKSRSGKKK